MIEMIVPISSECLTVREMVGFEMATSSCMKKMVKVINIPPQSGIFLAEVAVLVDAAL